MPRRDDLRHVMVIGSGPIVIGQAAEFDYSGTQACRVLRAEGLRVIIRPSGTEPKVKAYLEVVEPVTAPDALAAARTRATERLSSLRDEVAALLKA